MIDVMLYRAMQMRGIEVTTEVLIHLTTEVTRTILKFQGMDNAECLYVCTGINEGNGSADRWFFITIRKEKAEKHLMPADMILFTLEAEELSKEAFDARLIEIRHTEGIVPDHDDRYNRCETSHDKALDGLLGKIGISPCPVDPKDLPGVSNNLPDLAKEAQNKGFLNWLKRMFGYGS